MVGFRPTFRGNTPPKKRDGFYLDPGSTLGWASGRLGAELRNQFFGVEGRVRIE